MAFYKVPEKHGHVFLVGLYLELLERDPLQFRLGTGLALLEVLVEAGRLDAHVVLAHLPPLPGDHSLVATLQRLAAQRLARVLLPAELGGPQVLEADRGVVAGADRYSGRFTVS